jgi:hypothetical protein
LVAVALAQQPATSNTRTCEQPVALPITAIDRNLRF